MQTRTIPIGEWRPFLDGFSRQHDGWLVNVEVDSLEYGAQPEIEDLPLAGISADTVSAGEGTIEIFVGREPDQRATHTIAHATGLALEQAESGADVALQVKAADGTATLLRFRAPALPETVDHVVAMRTRR
ncbi:MAG: DUF5335 family protein [Acidobacteriota bacterium]|nr:DUF5335 family protein [Acidobacteriota bacterium]